MDVGLIIDFNIMNELLSTINLLEQICNQIEPTENGNRTSIAIFGNHSTVVTTFSDAESKNTTKLIKEVEKYIQEFPKNSSQKIIMENESIHYYEILDLALKKIFSPNETRVNAIKSLIFIMENGTLEHFSTHCKMCIEWILQNRINFYIIETTNSSNRFNERPLKINWLTEINYYPLTNLNHIIDILPTIFSLSCNNNITSNSAIFKSNTLDTTIHTTNNRRHLLPIQPEITNDYIDEIEKIMIYDKDMIDNNNCTFNIQKIGCFNKNIRHKMNIPSLIRDCIGMLCRRSRTHMENILCACAKNSIQHNVSYFGVNKYGFCFIHKNPIDIDELNESLTNDCHNTDAKICQDNDKLCYGGRDSIVLYHFT